MSELAERLRRLQVEAGVRPGSGKVRSDGDGVQSGPSERVSVGLDRARPASEGLRALLRSRLEATNPCRRERSEVSPTSAERAARERVRKPPDQGVQSSARDPLAECQAALPCAREISPGLFESVEWIDLETPTEWPWLPDLHPQPMQSQGLLHFDTETTGLSGGAGTRAFMLGISRWGTGGLEVRQVWIQRLSAEPRMLERFSQWLKDCPGTLVSYNGRCFDAPLLSARYRMHRMQDPMAELRHLDLLPSVRRHFRRCWPSCRLSEAETRLLGVRRLNDLPGSEVPAAFLELLRSGDSRPFDRVREHHRQDLISLAQLLPSLSALSSRAPEDWCLVPP